MFFYAVDKRYNDFLCVTIAQIVSMPVVFIS